MEKNYKKILGIIPLVMALVLGYGMVSGKLEEFINNIKDGEVGTGGAVEETENIEVEVSDDGEIIYEEPEAVELVYKDRKLQLSDTYEWYTEPLVTEYDVNNKNCENGAYGITVNERNWESQCRAEIAKLNAKDNMEESQKGYLKFDKNCVKDIDSEIDLRMENLKAKVENISISETISQEELEYFLPDFEGISEYMEADGKIQNMNILIKYGDFNNPNIETINSKIYFVKVTITYKSSSPWVQESNLSPDIVYLKEGEDCLEYVESETMAGLYSDSRLVSFSGLGGCRYFNDDFYNYSVDAYGIPTLYPMMDGEEVTREIGYLIPEIYLDNAYFLYHFGYSDMEDTYKDKYDVLIKVKQD